LGLFSFLTLFVLQTFWTMYYLKLFSNLMACFMALDIWPEMSLT